MIILFKKFKIKNLAVKFGIFYEFDNKYLISYSKYSYHNN